MFGNFDVKQIERNVFRDYCQDGLADMVFGASCLFWGLLLLVGSGGFVIFPMVFFAPLLKGLKKRFTYPRTGYVELRQGDPGPVLGFSLGSLVLGLVALVAVLIAAGVIADPAQWYRWMPIFFGIWLAGILLGLGLSVDLMRYSVVAGVALAGGPISIGLFCAALGSVLLAWGVVTFVRFLREYPLPAEGIADVTT
jgi:hypothetical protein